MEEERKVTVMDAMLRGIRNGDVDEEAMKSMLHICGGEMMRSLLTAYKDLSAYVDELEERIERLEELNAL